MRPCGARSAAPAVERQTPLRPSVAAELAPPPRPFAPHGEKWPRDQRTRPLLPARLSYGPEVSQLGDFCCAGRGDPVRRSRLRPAADAGTR
jgi:hypothetical protein